MWLIFPIHGDERLVVLNRVAKSVAESVRGNDDAHVFTYRGHPITRMLNTGWQKARIQAGLPRVRVHDLKHTFSRRPGQLEWGLRTAWTYWDTELAG